MKRGSSLNSPRIVGRAFELLAAFSAGVICTAFFNNVSLIHPRIASHNVISRAAITARNTSRKSDDQLLNIPLGLQWYQKSYDNRWAASINYTGVEDLDAAFRHVLSKREKLPRVVVSFTSLPKRFSKHAREMLRILKRQSYLPDKIYVNIPQSSRRSNNPFHLPSWLTGDPLIRVLRPKEDMGPATKLIPTLHEEAALGHSDTRIITVDDDNEGGWNEQTVLNLFAYSLVFDNVAIGLTGWNVTCMLSDARCNARDSGVPQRQFSDRFYNFIKAADDYACHTLSDWLPGYYTNCLGAVRKNYIAEVDVLEGYKGVLYQPRFFDLTQLDSLLDKSRTPAFFFLCDDVWFSGWLGVRGVKRIVVNPAIYEDAPIHKNLKRYSKARNLSSQILPDSENDKKIANAYAEMPVEKGLHDLSLDFVQSNHQGVKWFQERNAWVPDLWTRPNGFLYPSERNRAT